MPAFGWYVQHAPNVLKGGTQAVSGQETFGTAPLGLHQTVRVVWMNRKEISAGNVGKAGLDGWNDKRVEPTLRGWG